MSKIAGISIDYTSNIELTATGNSVSLEALKATLTVTNKSVARQISELQKKIPSSPKHAAAIAWKVKELEAQKTHTLYAENEDGSLSLPPGFWYLGDIRGTSHLNTVKPVLLGDERYYQQEIVAELLRYKRSCVVAATGTGKGRLIRDLVLSYVEAGKRVLVCVPSIELLSQTAEVIDSGLVARGHARCGKLGAGKSPKEGSMCVISTIQSAINIVDRFQCVIADELHVIAAESYQRVAAGAVSAEFFHGLTATIDRPDGLTPLIYAWCGPPVYKYPYQKAVKDGFLSPIKYHTRRIHSAARTYPNMHSTKEYIAVHSADGFIAEVAKITNNSLRAGRKTLVLFKASECCEKLAALLGTQAANGNYRKPLEDFKQGKTDLLIGNTSLLSTGLDIPQIAAIIFVAAGTSEILFMQSMGRGTRIAEGKKDCVVVDVVPDHRKFIRQGEVRRRMAIEAGYEVT
jgi:superfamily II DNA or RNA helicase